MNRPVPLPRCPLLLAAMGAASLLAAQEPEPVRPALPVKAVKLVSPQSPAQEPTQEDLRQRRAQKLQKPVFKLAAWRTDFDAARKEAAAQDKLILVYFTRSYAH